LLIIDDDPDMAELLGHMADVLGHAHEYVPNSARAFEAIHREPPDVIVLDVMLEDTDGWAVYRELVPITRAPIIFITAFRTSENRRRAEQMAASRRADGGRWLPGQADLAQRLRPSGSGRAWAAGAAIVGLKERVSEKRLSGVSRPTRHTPRTTPLLAGTPEPRRS